MRTHGLIGRQRTRWGEGLWRKEADFRYKDAAYLIVGAHFQPSSYDISHWLFYRAHGGTNVHERVKKRAKKQLN